MKVSKKFAEVEWEGEDEASPVTVRFPKTKAEITITTMEAMELWQMLSAWRLMRGGYVQ